MEINLAASRGMLERSAAHADVLFDTDATTIPIDDLRSRLPLLKGGVSDAHDGLPARAIPFRQR
jgi:hypothetical protein